VTPDAPDVLEARLADPALGEESPARVDALNALVYGLDLNEPQRRLALAREARALAERLGYAEGRALAVGLEGHALYLLSDHAAALALVTEALEGLDPASEAHRRLRSVLASIHVSLGNYEEALAIALDQLEQARARGDREGEGWLLHGLSGAFLDTGDVERALDYAMQELDVFTALGWVVGQARAHSSVGSVLRHMGRLDEARAHHEVSLTLFREGADRFGESRALHDLGTLAQEQRDLPRALDLHRQALDLRRAHGNRQAQTTSLLHIGETLAAMGRVDEALAPLHEALEIAEALGIRPRVYQVHRALADAYEAQGDFRRALHHYRAYHAVCETVLDSETSGRLQTMQVRHEAERARQEAEIARLRNVELREKNEQLEKLLTELKRTQDRLVQSEKMASLGRLTAGIAHEIKNPLNFVVNFAQLAFERAGELRASVEAHRADLPADLNEELDDALDTFAGNVARVLDHARRADGIVRSMLGHVRASAGEHAPVALHVLLDQSIEAVFGGRAGDGGVAVVRDYDAGVGEVEASAAALGRVFVNLLENAAYAVRRHAAAAGPDYRPEVVVRTRALPGLVQVRVVDNGPGVPPALCTRLFEPFFTTKPPGEGTGLGLSLAYDIVTQGHGGSLAVHSREGEGATFVVTLPA